MTLFEKFVFLGLLITLPVQLGKHFWPHFTFIQGIRVDYLSPILYLSDSFFILLLVLSIPRVYRKLFNIVSKPLIMGLTLTIILSSVFAVQKAPAFYGIIKFLEFLYIAFYVSQTFKNYIGASIYITALWGVIEVIIAGFQLYLQRSLGGVFY